MLTVENVWDLNPQIKGIKPYLSKLGTLTTTNNEN